MRIVHENIFDFQEYENFLNRFFEFVPELYPMLVACCQVRINATETTCSIKLINERHLLKSQIPAVVFGGFSRPGTGSLGAVIYDVI